MVPGLPSHDTQGRPRHPSVATASSEGVTAPESAGASASASASASGGGGHSNQEGGTRTKNPSQTAGADGRVGPPPCAWLAGRGSFEATGPSIMKHVIQRYRALRRLPPRAPGRGLRQVLGPGGGPAPGHRADLPQLRRGRVPPPHGHPQSQGLTPGLPGEASTP